MQFLTKTKKKTSPYGIGANGTGIVCTPEYDKPWFELRDGEWYCNLCYSWATDGDIKGEKHRKSEAYPDSYGFPSQVVPVTQTQASSSKAEASQILYAIILPFNNSCKHSINQINLYTIILPFNSSCKHKFILPTIHAITHLFSRCAKDVVYG